MNLTNILVYNGHNGHTTGSLTLANIFIVGVLVYSLRFLTRVGWLFATPEPTRGTI